jgi:hypothetical protein
MFVIFLWQLRGVGVGSKAELWSHANEKGFPEKDIKRKEKEKKDGKTEEVLDGHNTIFGHETYPAKSKVLVLPERRVYIANNCY